MGPPGTPIGPPRGPERVSEEPNEIWHVGYQFSQFSALKMNKGSTYSVDCHWCLGRSIPFLFWSIHTLFTALKWCGLTKTKKGVDRQRHHWRSTLYVFHLIFHWRFNYFSKGRNYRVTHDAVESFLFLKECLYALAFSQGMYQVLHRQDKVQRFLISKY